MDRILKAEGDDPDRYKVAKQADAVMLFFLFSDEELRAIFAPARLRRHDDRSCPPHDRLLRPAHLARLDADARRARRRCSPAMDPDSSWERFLVRAGERHRATSRAARPRRASTWVSCPGPSTCCSAPTSAAQRPRRRAALRAAAQHTASTACAFSMSFRGTTAAGVDRRRRADRRRGRHRGVSAGRCASASAARSTSSGAGDRAAVALVDDPAHDPRLGACRRRAGPDRARTGGSEHERRLQRARSSTSTGCSSTPRTSRPGGSRCSELMEGPWSDIRDADDVDRPRGSPPSSTSSGCRASRARPGRRRRSSTSACRTSTGA